MELLKANPGRWVRLRLVERWARLALTGRLTAVLGRGGQYRPETVAALRRRCRDTRRSQLWVEGSPLSRGSRPTGLWGVYGRWQPIAGVASADQTGRRGVEYEMAVLELEQEVGRRRARRRERLQRWRQKSKGAGDGP